MTQDLTFERYSLIEPLEQIMYSIRCPTPSNLTRDYISSVIGIVKHHIVVHIIDRNKIDPFWNLREEPIRIIHSPDNCIAYSLSILVDEDAVTFLLRYTG